MRDGSPGCSKRRSRQSRPAGRVAPDPRSGASQACRPARTPAADEGRDRTDRAATAQVAPTVPKNGVYSKDTGSGISPRRGRTDQPRATPWVPDVRPTSSPERAGQGHGDVSPFQGSGLANRPEPRALPWADLWLPLRGDRQEPRYRCYSLVSKSGTHPPDRNRHRPDRSPAEPAPTAESVVFCRRGLCSRRFRTDPTDRRQSRLLQRTGGASVALLPTGSGPDRRRLLPMARASEARHVSPGVRHRTVNRSNSLADFERCSISDRSTSSNGWSSRRFPTCAGCLGRACGSASMSSSHMGVRPSDSRSGRRSISSPRALLSAAASRAATSGLAARFSERSANMSDGRWAFGRSCPLTSVIVCAFIIIRASSFITG